MKQSLRKIVLLLICGLVLIPTVDAQDYTEEIKIRAAQKVGQFCDFISFIASKEETLETRLYYCKKALGLFLAKGEPYTETFVNGNGQEKVIQREGVTMEVTSINRPGKNSRLMKKYLNGLANLNYSAVQIQSTEVADIKVSNLQKVGDNLYVTTCYFEQAFIGWRDGKPVYKDITRKRVKCYIFLEDTEDGIEPVVLLGDVTATDTQRL